MSEPPKPCFKMYAANTWYDVKVVAKPSTDKFDLYINNDLLINNQSFRNAITNLMSNMMNDVDDIKIFFNITLD